MNSFDSVLEKTKQKRKNVKNKKIIFNEYMKNLGHMELTPLKKVRESSSRGRPMVCKSDENKDNWYGIKLLANDYDFKQEKHPCYLEYIILREFNLNILDSDISPHIAHYYGTAMVNNAAEAFGFLKLKNRQDLRKKTVMLITKYMEKGDLYMWSKENPDASVLVWKSIIFQVLYTLYVLQKKYEFVHSDLAYTNILVDATEYTEDYFVYRINNTSFYIKNNNVLPLLWDFESSNLYKKTKNCYFNTFLPTLNHGDDIPQEFDEFYDMHYFLQSLLELKIPTEIRHWIYDIYPSIVIPIYSQDSSYYTDYYDSDREVSEDNEPCSSNQYNKKSRSSTRSKRKSRSKSYSSYWSSSSSSSSSSTGEYETEYLYDGRLKNTTKEHVKLPKPNIIFTHDFFAEFTTVPSDMHKPKEFVYK